MGHYFIYITTNINRTTLYLGVTNNFEQRIIEHYLNRGIKTTFAGKYNCFFLDYFETFQYINQAIERETEIKKWNRNKKEELINSINPEWKFLNKEVFGDWPPKEKIVHRN